MAREIIDGKKTDIKTKSRNPELEFDLLQMYFGRDYVIDLEDVPGSITITQPKLGDIINMGYDRFYSSLGILTTNTTSYKAFLWDFGINWNEISDFELFMALYQGVDTEVSKMIFNGLDITEFKPFETNKDDERIVFLYHQELDIEINENVYFHFSQYLRNVFQLFPEEKITTSKGLQKMYIDRDKRAQKREKENKNTPNITKSFQAMISSCVNHPGFKYRLEELDQISVYQFYDSVKRLQIYENSTALLKGMYSGFVDGSNINSEEYNFMRE